MHACLSCVLSLDRSVQPGFLFLSGRETTRFGGAPFISLDPTGSTVSFAKVFLRQLIRFTSDYLKGVQGRVLMDRPCRSVKKRYDRGNSYCFLRRYALHGGITMSTCRLNVPDCHSIFPGNYGAGAELKAS